MVLRYLKLKKVHSVIPQYGCISKPYFPPFDDSYICPAILQFIIHLSNLLSHPSVRSTFYPSSRNRCIHPIINPSIHSSSNPSSHLLIHISVLTYLHPSSSNPSILQSIIHLGDDSSSIYMSSRYLFIHCPAIQSIKTLFNPKILPFMAQQSM